MAATTHKTKLNLKHIILGTAAILAVTLMTGCDAGASHERSDGFMKDACTLNVNKQARDRGFEGIHVKEVVPLGKNLVQLYVGTEEDSSLDFTMYCGANNKSVFWSPVLSDVQSLINQ